MKYIGVLGGSFDPVHNGHLSLAQDALQQAGLDQVILMPVHVQPFKQALPMTEDAHRLAMLKAACLPLERITVSDLELRLKGVSYTYLTLARLQETLGEDVGISFITGTDSFLKMHLWKEAPKLLAETRILVGSRPGYKEEELEAQRKGLSLEFGADILVIQNTLLDISSTGIRGKIKGGESISELVPPLVERYIHDHGLYQGICNP